jgi:hypothetical protein
MNAPAPHVRLLRTLLGGASLALLTQACGDEATIIDNTGNAGTGGSSGAGMTAGTGENAGTGGNGQAGDANGNSGSAGTGGGAGDDATVELSGEITASTTWTADKTYILTDLTFVVGNSTLTIEPGTKIFGGGVGSALIVTRGSQLIAEGTATAPIVFSSNIPVGLRDPGDWGGVALLGAATVNVSPAELEGIEADGTHSSYGGTDDASSCGSLKYVRIEFGGFEFSTDNELNGLTFAGCGSGTSVDFVQVHRGSDDGIEVFGGKVDLKHIILSNNQDDSLDWDFGWTGRAQFVVVRHDVDASDAGFEADNGNPSTEVLPRSEPLIYNATLVGSTGSTSPGMVLRRGTWGAIRNSIVTGFPVSGIDIRDAFSVDGTEVDPLRLTVENSIIFQNGEGGTEAGETEPLDGMTGDDDGSFDENAFLTDVARNNQFTDPGLPDTANVTAPTFVPAAGSIAATGAATPPAGFDVSAVYIGAFEPGGTDWSAGWTSYPED